MALSMHPHPSLLCHVSFLPTNHHPFQTPEAKAKAPPKKDDATQDTQENDGSPTTATQDARNTMEEIDKRHEMKRCEKYRETDNARYALKHIKDRYLKDSDWLTSCRKTIEVITMINSKCWGLDRLGKRHRFPSEKAYFAHCQELNLNNHNERGSPQEGAGGCCRCNEGGSCCKGGTATCSSCGKGGSG